MTTHLKASGGFLRSGTVEGERQMPHFLRGIDAAVRQLIPAVLQKMDLVPGFSVRDMERRLTAAVIAPQSHHPHQNAQLHVGGGIQLVAGLDGHSPFCPSSGPSTPPTGRS